MRFYYLLTFLFFSLITFSQSTDADLVLGIANENGEVVPFASVQLVNTDIGQKYSGTTNENGSLTIKSIPANGKYRLEIISIGTKGFVEENFRLKLGVNQRQIVLESGVELKEVVVEQSQSNISEGLSLNEALLNKAPSVKHRIQDAIQRVPTVHQNSFNGHNYRYNDLRIDGVGMNDMIGFQEPASGSGGSVASSTPGALAQTQPISMEAIEQLQVLQSSSDVRIGGTTSGTVNAITKSGSNNVEGMVYGNLRNHLITGGRPNGNDIDIPEFEEYRAGANLGGPIIKNKLFYFVNVEQQKNTVPLQNAPGDPGVGIPVAIAQEISDSLISKYNYNPGSYRGDINTANSIKALARIDFYKSPSNRFTLRYNVVSAFADNLERTQNILRYSTQGYRHNSLTNSVALEWNKTTNSGHKNKLSLGFNQVDEKRSYEGDIFPHIEIDYNTSNTILAGTYREASVYSSLVNSYHLQNDYQFSYGKHNFVIGTRAELHDLNYFFLTAWNGRWEYASLQDFYDDRPNRIRGVYSYGENDFNSVSNTPSAAFDYLSAAVYIQDNYEVSDKLSLTGGLRIEGQNHFSEIPVLERVSSNPAFDGFNNKLNEKIQINPRFNAEYQLEKGKITLSSGLFTGRVPLAWYAYPHYISGRNYGNVDIKPGGDTVNITEIENLVQPGNNLTEINLLADNFSLPRYFKTMLEYEFQRGKNNFKLGFLYDKAINEIWVRSLNLVDSTSNLSGVDNRPYYVLSGNEKKVEDSFTNVFVMDNTNKGYKLTASASIDRRFSDVLNGGLAYAYSISKDVSNGVRNSFAANFNRNQMVDSRIDDLAFSNFDLRHKIIGHLTYIKPWNNKHISSLYSFVNIRSGSPFSFIYSGDLNSDGSSRNDLFFVPEKREDIVLVDIVDESGNVIISADQQWASLDEFISENKYLDDNRGGYTERNGGRTPWNKSVDIRINHNIVFKNKQRLQLQWDIFNVLNLVNSNWGVQNFVSNSSNSSFSILSYKGRDANNNPTYQYKHDGSNPWQVDNFASRWQMQFGVKYFFGG